MTKLFYHTDNSGPEPVISVTYAQDKAEAVERFRESGLHADRRCVHHVRFEHGDVAVLTDY